MPPVGMPWRPLGDVTLQVRANGTVVTAVRVPADGRFEVREPPGTYTLGVQRGWNCTSTVVVRSGTERSVTLRCTPKANVG